MTPRISRLFARFRRQLRVARYYWSIFSWLSPYYYLHTHLLGRRLLVSDTAKYGLKAPLDIRPKTTDVGTFKKVFVDKEYECEWLANPKVIIDAGANVGYAAIFFAIRYPEAKIIAIEPEQGNFDILLSNVAAYPNIVPMHCGLWDSDGEIALVDPGLGEWGFQTESVSEQANSPSAVITGRSLPSVAQQHGIDKIDLLKVDIEGAEKEVFEASSHWLDRVNAVVIEVHEQLRTGARAAVENAMAEFEDSWVVGENEFFVRHK